MFIIQKVNLLKKLFKKFKKIEILYKKFNEFYSFSGSARLSSTYLI